MIHNLPFNETMLPPKQTIVPLPGRMQLLHQLPAPRIIWLDEAPSTHTLLKELLAKASGASVSGSLFPVSCSPQLLPYTMTAARRQTAGRGQRGNSWESEDFKNLTFSMPAYPQAVPPAAQFSISEAVALAVVALLQLYGIEASVKWPNDIYVGDKKICGILIDHSLLGARIQYSILSAGLNINQLRFLSDAPNPVSMLLALQQQYPKVAAEPPAADDALSATQRVEDLDIERIARELQLLIRGFVESASTADGREILHQSFMKHLYRYDGRFHPFRDEVRGEDIEGKIEEISPMGILTLLLPDGSRRSYAFKEVAFIV